MSEHSIIMGPESVRGIIGGTKTMTRRVDSKRYASWKVGDYLWVKEDFKIAENVSVNGVYPPIYKADCDDDLIKNIKHWRYSMFMPRRVSRILLEITNIRVERLQDITEDDAIKEGYDRRDTYAWAWNAINAKRGYPWSDNSWVVVVEFKRVEAKS